jgi:hypothetical protein
MILHGKSYVPVKNIPASNFYGGFGILRRRNQRQPNGNIDCRWSANDPSSSGKNDSLMSHYRRSGLGCWQKFVE